MKLFDSGYQGVQKLYKNVYLPIKKMKNKKLSREEREDNRLLAKLRVGIEHINRYCKIFRIVSSRYRGKHQNYGLVWNIIAGLVNLRYANI